MWYLKYLLVFWKMGFIFGFEHGIPQTSYYIIRNDTTHKLEGYIQERRDKELEIKKFYNLTALDYVIIGNIKERGKEDKRYAEILKLFNLDTPKRLLIHVDDESDLVPWKFEGLKVEILLISHSSKRHQGRLKLEGLLLLENLRELLIFNANLKELPAIKLRKLLLIDGQSIGDLGDCSYLEDLKLSHWNTTLLPRSWLSNCTKIKSMTLDRQSVKSVRKALEYDGAKYITDLTISHTFTKISLSLGDLIYEYKNLKRLKLDHNRINTIPRDLMKFDALEDLDLSHNELIYINDIFYIITQASKLVNFTAADNPRLDICNFNLGVRDSIFCYGPNLKRMSFANTATTNFCFIGVFALSLEYLDLSGTKIQSLTGAQREISPFVSLKEVNLTGVPIHDYNFTEEDYWTCRKRRSRSLKLTGVTLSLKCDCYGALLANAIREKILTVNAFCGTTRLENVPQNTIACDNYKCESCMCRRSWSDGSVKAECNTGNQKNIPRISNLKQLMVIGNLIEDFNATDLSKDLVELDLSQNHISKLDTSTLDVLFNVSDRQVYLSGNPIICTCENVEMLEALQKHKDQILDYKTMTCVGGDSLVSSIDVNKLCKIPNSLLEIALSVTLGVAAFVAGAITLWIRFKQQIKIFLYAKGLCLWWLSEEEIDSDRPYDAFISFAHGDDDFVLTNLLPELETMGYRVCVHYRDWVPGEWIPAQIQRSVQLSRRTIIVISKNYLASIWGMMEFRIAHLSTLKEGRPRIIALMLEDITMEDLNDELKGYLDSNTYVKWGEKWFWDKMKYGLQHRTNSVEMREENIPMHECAK